MASTLETPPRAQVDALMTLYRQGRLQEAVARATLLAQRYPDAVLLHEIAGLAHARLGRFEPALERFDRLLQLRPDHADAHGNRGNALKQLRRPDEALASYDRALALRPDHAAVHNNRGAVLKDLGRLDDALASCDKALALTPDYAQAHHNRGVVLRELKRPDDALASFEAALVHQPDFAEAHRNRGDALRELRQPGEALASFEAALALKPDDAHAHNGRGIALTQIERLDEAIASFDQALALMPDHAQAHNNRGNALQVAGRLGEAIASFEAALALRPDLPGAMSQLCHLRARICDWSDAPPRLDPSEPGLDGVAVSPFSMLALDDDPLRQLERARAFASGSFPQAPADPMRPLVPSGRIRIGYFSADFHEHATMCLMARLLELHDRGRFEIHLFSYGADHQDAMRRRVMSAADQFHDLRALSDQAAAALARGLAIDVAVDLKGYTTNGRPGIFACRTAPVQISYLGYPGSMGAPFIDYIVADNVVLPPEDRGFYAEKVICLPHSYQANDDQRAISTGHPNRAALGLPESGFVFCCFNSSYKISPAEFDIWMRLLGKTRGSVLWLLRDNPWAQASLRRAAGARGIDPDRLVFAERRPLADHLARHRCADLFLDTFAYNAHTTASDALWAGLPVLTRPGRSFASRVAASLLRAIDLPELVTQTAQDYERLALDLATNADRLAAIKARLAGNRLIAPLFDSARFTGSMEQAYARACERSRAGLPADHIQVEP